MDANHKEDDPVQKPIATLVLQVVEMWECQWKEMLGLTLGLTDKEIHGCTQLFGIQSCPALFELAGKGFFFFFVVVQNGFDMFGNVIQVMS